MKAGAHPVLTAIEAMTTSQDEPVCCLRRYQYSSGSDRAGGAQQPARERERRLMRWDNLRRTDAMRTDAIGQTPSDRRHRTDAIGQTPSGRRHRGDGPAVKTAPGGRAAAKSAYAD